MPEQFQANPEYIPNRDILESYADIILASVRRKTDSGEILKGVQPGDKIVVSFPEEANALVAMLRQRIQEKNGIFVPQQDSLLIELALTQILTPEELEKSAQTLINALAATTNHFIDIASIRSYEGIDEDQVSRFDQLGRAMRRMFSNAANDPAKPMQSRVKVYWPTAALATQNNTSVEEIWTDLSRGLLLDTPDPLARMIESDSAVKDNTERLNRLKITQLRIISGSGDTDVSFSLAQDSRWRGASGANRPSFESFTAPHRDTLNGRIAFDVPVKFGSSTFSKLTIEYRSGKAERIIGPDGTEDHPEAQNFRKLINQYPNFDRLGEFALTPKKLAQMQKGYGVILWTENLPGFHVAHGSAYPANYGGTLPKPLSDEQRWTLGYNTCAAHFDLVRMGDFMVTATLADGSDLEIFSNGNFTEEFYMRSNSNQTA